MKQICIDGVPIADIEDDVAATLLSIARRECGQQIQPLTIEADGTRLHLPPGRGLVMCEIADSVRLTLALRFQRRSFIEMWNDPRSGRVSSVFLPEMNSDAEAGNC